MKAIKIIMLWLTVAVTSIGLCMEADILFMLAWFTVAGLMIWWCRKHISIYELYRYSGYKWFDKMLTSY